MRWLLWRFCLLAESYEIINHYHYRNNKVPTLLQRYINRAVVYGCGNFAILIQSETFS